MKFNQGQTVIGVLMWGIGLMASAGLGLNFHSLNTNANQDEKISEINREVGELTRDIVYIRESVDKLMEAQGIPLKTASTTRQ